MDVFIARLHTKKSVTDFGSRFAVFARKKHVNG